MTIGVGLLLALSAALFGIGVFGLLSRRSLAGVLMALVLMLTASSIALVGFARFGYNDIRPLSGMTFAMLVSVVMSAEVALGVSLLLLLNRRRGGIDVVQLDEPSPGAELTS